METLIYIAAANAIALYCIFNEWTRWSKSDRVCMFCVIWWVSVAEMVVIGIVSYSDIPTPYDCIAEFLRASFLAVATNIAYFYVKHLHE